MLALASVDDDGDRLRVDRVRRARGQARRRPYWWRRVRRPGAAPPGYPASGDAPDVAALREGSQPYLSLARAIRELLTQAVEDAGTLSGAAHPLGLRARSLRRMLANYPPPR